MLLLVVVAASVQFFVNLLLLNADGLFDLVLEGECGVLIPLTPVMLSMVLLEAWVVLMALLMFHVTSKVPSKGCLGDLSRLVVVIPEFVQQLRIDVGRDLFAAVVLERQIFVLVVSAVLLLLPGWREVLEWRIVAWLVER